MFKYFRALSAFLKAKKEMTSLMATKDGWKTTEFWVNLFIILITLFAGVAGFLPAALVAKIIAGLAAVYTVARAFVKVTPSPKDDEIVARIGKVIEDKLGIKPVDPS